MRIAMTISHYSTSVSAIDLDMHRECVFMLRML